MIGLAGGHGQAGASGVGAGEELSQERSPWDRSIQAVERVFEASFADARDKRLRRATEEAQARGIFGAPSFFVDDELFIGNDRLEAALELWGRRATMPAKPA